MNEREAQDTVKFGGFAFTHAMEKCFVAQSECLEDFLNAHVQKIPHPAGLVLANAHRSAKTVCELISHAAVNEAHLLMRVLVEELVDAIYLLHCSDETRKSFLGKRDLFPHLKPNDLTNEGIQTAEATKFDGQPQRILGPLRQRIDFISEKTGTDKRQWHLAMGSIFPTASEFAAGSIAGYMAGFTGGKNGDTNGQKLSMIAFLGVGLIEETICIFSKSVSDELCISSAREVLKRANELMSQSEVGLRDLTAGAWSMLERIERLSKRNRKSELALFQKAFELSYEAGVIVTTLKGKSDRPLKMSALYLRRALSDFRSVWIMISSGYTSQAALSAGSLFESCRAATCLTYPEYIAEFESKLGAQGKAAELPWKPKKMAEMVALKQMTSTDTKIDYENSWRALYARYVWLSQIRHSTFQSVIHDISATRLGDDNRYVVMACPNFSEEDMPVKLGVLFGALADMQHVISDFASAIGYPADQSDQCFDDRMKRVGEILAELMRNYDSKANPISLQETWFARKFPLIKKS